MSLRTSKNKNASMRKADAYFSKYIRLSHSDRNGYCTCVTCGNRKHWKQMHCGHWRRRGLQPTRYDSRNCAPQCVHCNHFRSGEPERFEEFIKIRFGEDVVEELRLKSLMRSGRKQKHFEQIAKKYYHKVKQLETISIN